MPHREIRSPSTMSIRHTAVLAALVTSTAALSAAAQSIAGSWEGASVLRGDATHVTIVLDSGATAWSGTLSADGLPGGSVRLDSVVVRGSEASMRLPASVAPAVLRGALSADRLRIDGRVYLQGDSGVFHLVRPGTPALAAILDEVELVPVARRARGREPQPDPDSARLVTSDIDRFWTAVGRAPEDSLARYLRREYIEPGSAGLQDFIPGRIKSSAALAESYRKNRARYDAARPNMARIAEAAPQIHAAFRRFKAMYPEAKFPDVYFVVGRFNSGGTSKPSGLILGAEMIRDVNGLPWLAAHELVHFQQRDSGSPTLLAQAFAEGTADFVASLVMDRDDSSEKYRYGLAHEHELWTEFAPQMHGTERGIWMYTKPPGDRPNDLGYFIGSRIARAYYERATDKRAALRELILADDVDEILRRSGYSP
jgi:hypothetical protein